MAQRAQSGWQKGLAHAAAYLAWFGAIAVSGAVFLLGSSSLEQWYVLLDFRANAHKAASRFFLFFGGMGWLAFIFFTESYFRTGVVRGRLATRVLKVAVALGFALVLSGASYLLVPWFLGV